MADGEKILRINALGTVYMNQEFCRRMKRGNVIVDISSNSAYVLPKFLISTKTYALAETDEELFLQKILKKCKMAKEGYARNGFAYAFSKNFVVWYAQKCAFSYGCTHAAGHRSAAMALVRTAQRGVHTAQSCFEVLLSSFTPIPPRDDLPAQ